MFFTLFERATSASLLPYWTQARGVYCVMNTVPSWNMDIQKFEEVLLSKPTDGSKVKIILPNLNSVMTEYVIEPAQLYSRKTLQKYPNQLFAFRGNSTANPGEKIGIVYCFQLLKVFYVGHHQTLEPYNSLSRYFIYDIDAWSKTIPTGKDEMPAESRETTPHFMPIIPPGGSVPKDIYTPIDDPKISNVAEYMNSVKIIRLLLFPTVETVQQFLNNRGVYTYGFTRTQKQQILFVELASSVHYMNLIYLPEVSIRFEFVFDYNLVLLDNTDANKLKYSYSTKSVGQSSKMSTFVNQYIDDKDIDLAHLVHAATNEGSTNLQMLKPFNKDKYIGISMDTFQIFGYFETTLCHEVGHQLGAPHTWNYKYNMYPTGVEPGSGISIMGYPGRCGKSDVQGGWDPIFSWISIERMQSWVSRQYHLKDEPKNNRPPTIDNMKRYFVIPKGTAFLLAGSAHDPDNDILYYQWDQCDIIPAGSTIGTTSSATFKSTRDNGPLFRAFLPTRDNYRFCPKLERIKAGTLTDDVGTNDKSPDAWETVPTVARKLTFALVVRDRRIRSGEAGNVVVDKVLIDVVDADPFQITSFNTPTSVNKGQQKTVTWNVGGTKNAEINAQTVTIKFASDGEHFEQVLAEKVQNNGSCQVTFPSTSTTKGRIMIQGDDNIFIAINTADITIV